MDSTVIVALLSLLGTVAGSGFGVIASSKLTNYRIEQLEKKVDKHNTVIERTYNLEKNLAIVNEQIEGTNHRIKDLEEKEK